jgi:4-amino-4-deoxy-L-arabinose transferase-like glycosyltransferase
MDRWRLCLVFFLVVYAIVLSLNLSYMSMQWDEVNHFNGGLLLTRGNLAQYAATSSFYPPVFNLVTAGFFEVAGASVFVGRFVAVTFSVLSVAVVFEVARGLYGARVALASAALFAVMPGIVWLGRIAMIETMQLFVFCVSMLFFLRWMKTNRQRDMAFSLAAFAVGVAVKYQSLVVLPVIMVAYMLFWKRAYLKNQLATVTKYPRVIALAVAGFFAVVFLFVLYTSGLLQPWLYAIQVGTADKSLYSVRFPIPIFYFVEMTWPYSNAHPISLFLYALGLAGLGFFALRHRREDKYLLVWFLAVYAIFTLIPNRQWRYVTLLFPVLAVSAASLLASSLGGARRIWQSTKSSLTKKTLAKTAAVLLIAFTAVGFYFSTSDAYSWVAKDQLNVPLDQAAAYALPQLGADGAVMVVCPMNLISQDMVWFYLNSPRVSQNQVYQYPELAVDSYTPTVNMAELAGLCRSHGVKCLFLYENGEGNRFFQSDLTSQKVFDMLNSTQSFTYETSVGTAPYRVFIFSFP